VPTPRHFLLRSTNEHHARPAINPLFRSVALELGPRVIGVVLTGMLDDGAAGMHAVKACGGTTVFQDPLEAAEPSMPRHAMAAAPVDHILRLDAMTDLLNKLAQPLASAPAHTPPEWLRIEHAISVGKSSLQELRQIASPSGFTCPDCGGALFELSEGKPVRFLCHTGHAFSLLSMALGQENVAEEALWAALRALQEKEAILRRLAELPTPEETRSRQKALAEADELAEYIQKVRATVVRVPGERGP
jgi:two-component system chemotaxis response regulator CheB